MTEHLSTGSTKLDGILHGGIAIGGITQFYGGPGSGKTEICYNLSTLIQPEFKSIIISTGSKFRMERIENIAEAKGLDAQRILQNILVSSARDTHDLHYLIKSARTRIESDPGIKLLMIDSIVELYRADESFHGQVHIPKRQHELSKDMFILSNIAATKNIAVLITNQSIPASLLSSHIVPTGGYIISMLSNNIVYLKKGSSNVQYTKYSARLIKPDGSKSDVKFAINSAGIHDIL